MKRAWLLTTLLAAPASAQPLDLAGIEGAYRATRSEATGPVEDILEIVRTSPGTVYFRTRLAFANGHHCAIHGIARQRGNALHYNRPATTPDTPECSLTLRWQSGRVTFQEEGGTCRRETCGARGIYDGVELPAASRRPITYLERLRASREFTEAMAEFEARPR